MSAGSQLQFVLDATLPEDSTWEQTLLRHRGSPLHHPAVHRPDNEPRALHALRLVRGDEELGCALAIEQRQRRWRLPFGGSTALILPSAPAIASNVDSSDARRALMKVAREHGCDRLVVQPACSEWLVEDEQLAAYRDGGILEFVMPLASDVDAVRSSFHKVHRKNARRAANKGVTVVEDSSAEGLLRLRDMQVASAERASERNNAFGVRGEEYFRRVHEAVYSSGLGHVFFARLEDEWVAALAWLQLGSRAQTVRSGSTAAGYQNYAMYALYDALVERLAGEGVTELNAGGVPAEATDSDHPQHGLYEFKKGYGGTPSLRHGLEIPREGLRS